MLSQFETREAQALMTEALEAMDFMNNAIVLQNEVNTLSAEVCCNVCASIPYVLSGCVRTIGLPWIALVQHVQQLCHHLNCFFIALYAFALM